MVSTRGVASGEAMTNDETRMTKEVRMPKEEARRRLPIRASGFIPVWSFGFRAHAARDGRLRRADGRAGAPIVLVDGSARAPSTALRARATSYFPADSSAIAPLLTCSRYRSRSSRAAATCFGSFFALTRGVFTRGVFCFGSFFAFATGSGLGA